LSDLLETNRRRATWILFAALGVFLPVPFFLLVIGGLVPFLWILIFTIKGAAVGIPKMTKEAFVMVGILLSHLLVLALPLYGLSVAITRLLFRVLSPRLARLAVLLMVAGLAIASLFPIYHLAGHSRATPINILRVFQGWGL
jgi:hypothetical protein